MAKRHGIIVDVLIEGETQKIYDDPHPQGGISKPKTSTFYVEAVTDAIFEINVAFGRGFQLRGAHSADVDVYLDGNWVGGGYMSKNHLRSPNERYFTISSCSLYDPESRKRRMATFSFGSLTVLESTGTEVESSVKKNIGKILIKIKRVFRYKKDYVPSTRTRYRSPEFDSVSEIAEKDLKGQAIENAIKPVFGRPLKRAKASRPSKYYYEPLPGPDGEDMSINILYRSKRTLQMLGCISKTPSPSPDSEEEEWPVSTTEDQKPEINQESESEYEPEREQTPEKIRTARADLAAYEESQKMKTRVKPEVDLTEPGTSTKARVKRERTGDVQFLSHKRLRATAPADSEVIDLTDD